MRAQHRWGAWTERPPAGRLGAGGTATRWLSPLDWLRTRVLLATRPWSGFFAGHRDERVALTGAIIVLVALALTGLAPLWLLALGPIILGVPHLVADLRYCGLRSGLLTRRTTVIACGLPLLIMGLWGGLALGFVAVAAAFALTPGRSALRIAGCALALGAMGIAIVLPIQTTIVMAHAHNFIAVALWWMWRPRKAHHLWVPALLGLGTLLIMGGAFDARLAMGSGPAAPELSFAAHAELLTNNLAATSGPPWAGRWVLLFAFAQAVHYGVWLHLVRDDDRSRATPRTFARSYRVLRAEFGTVLLAIVALACGGLAVWASIDLLHARAGYFRFAQFHGSLELCAAAIVITRGRARA